MTKVVIIGSGIIGSTIAYKLSQNPTLDITLIDKQTPATGSTGAALGVLMGIISGKTKGRAWQLRESSLKTYKTLLPELEALTGLSIPSNEQGILKLLFTDKDVATFQKLSEFRCQQGYNLEIWTSEMVKFHCPQIEINNLVGAVYSPEDKQINPIPLTEALVKGASLNGVSCIFDENVQQITPLSQYNYQIDLSHQTLYADWVVIATGLGTSGLIESLGSDLAIKPVLGQALLIQQENWYYNYNFNPVITGNDVHIVPIANGKLWVGATVEFPRGETSIIPQKKLLEDLYQTAISFCPKLTEGQIVSSWVGKRPRPEGKPAPIIERLANNPQILLATGHYRNGVLLAPATADAIASMILITKTQ
jgi:glycine oxidase